MYLAKLQLSRVIISPSPACSCYMHAAGAHHNQVGSADKSRISTSADLTPAGGNAGLGRETVRVLAAAGAHVVFTTRSAERGQQVAKELAAGGLKVCHHSVRCCGVFECSLHFNA
jgi:short chain dehydrogenase